MSRKPTSKRTRPEPKAPTMGNAAWRGAQLHGKIQTLRTLFRNTFQCGTTQGYKVTGLYSPFR
jgi:hypothetical protein